MYSKRTIRDADNGIGNVEPVWEKKIKVDEHINMTKNCDEVVEVRESYTVRRGRDERGQ